MINDNINQLIFLFYLPLLSFCQNVFIEKYFKGNSFFLNECLWFNICLTMVSWTQTLKKLLTKYQIFTKFPQISHIHKNIFSFKLSIAEKKIDQLFLLCKLYGRDKIRIYFQFCQLWDVYIRINITTENLITMLIIID